jgi:hypothetical protein
LQLPLEEGNVLLDSLAQDFPIKPHGRVIAHEIFTPVALDDPAPRLVEALDAEQLLGGDAAEQQELPSSRISFG